MCRRENPLAVLDHPFVPLHNNSSENALRSYVTRRNTPAGTRNDVGRDARDAHLSVMNTCGKLEISYWELLADRSKVPDATQIPSPSSLVVDKMTRHSDVVP